MKQAVVLVYLKAFETLLVGVRRMIDEVVENM